MHLTAALRSTVSRIVAYGGRRTVTVPVELIDTAGRSSLSQVTLALTRLP